MPYRRAVAEFNRSSMVPVLRRRIGFDRHVPIVQLSRWKILIWRRRHRWIIHTLMAASAEEQERKTEP